MGVVEDSRAETKKAKHRAKMRLWRLKNPEKVKAQRRAWHETAVSTPEGRVAESRKKHARYAKNWFSKLVYAARVSTRRRGHAPVAVTAEQLKQLFEKQEGLCYWTGVPMTLDSKSPWKVSLDRLDGSRSYTLDNVVLCGWFINRARGAMTTEQFRAVLSTLGWQKSEVA